MSYPTGTIIGSETNQATGKHRLFTVALRSGFKEYLTADEDDCITPSWESSIPGFLGPYVYAVIAPDNAPWIAFSDGLRVAPGLHPAYSPDGQRIIFTTLPMGISRSEIAVMNLDCSNRVVLTNTTVADRTGHIQSLYGTFSPDGNKIVYASSQGGSLQIWTMDADGANKRQITGADAASRMQDANAPSWSPDGSRVAYFCGKEGDRGTIYVHDGLHRWELLTTAQTSNSDNPAWSPDGEWICFESDRQAPGETADPRTHRNRTWVIRSDGTGIRILLPYKYEAGRRPWR